MMADAVKYEKKESIAFISMNRPENGMPFRLKWQMVL